jgi:transcriptional regulator with XRE-family HTH domain
MRGSATERTAGGSEAGSFARWLDSIVPALFPTDAALARAIGVNQSTVTRWRRGTTPQVPALYALADSTRTDISTLLKIAGYGRPASGRKEP